MPNSPINQFIRAVEGIEKALKQIGDGVQSAGKNLKEGLEKLAVAAKELGVGFRHVGDNLKYAALAGTTVAIIAVGFGTKSCYDGRYQDLQERYQYLQEGEENLQRRYQNLESMFQTYGLKLSAAEEQRDLAQTALRRTYGARVHDALENPTTLADGRPSSNQESLTNIVDEWLESIGGRVHVYGPGCTDALGNLHTAIGGYNQDRAKFVHALNDVVCPGVNPEQRYVEFSK